MTVAAAGRQPARPRTGPLVAQLATWVAGLRSGDVPAEVRERIRDSVRDAIGCALFGSTLPWSHVLRDAAQAWSSDGTLAVWGTAMRLPPLEASLANGAALHGFELDDYNEVASIHGSSAMLPAVLAVAELRPPISGSTLITSLAAGWEVGSRVSRMMGADLLARGWHAPTISGTVAAATAAGRMLSLSPERLTHCIAFGVLQASGLLAIQHEGMGKRFYAGRAAQSGLMAALLAEKGYEGPSAVLEHPIGGFAPTFAQGAPFSLSELTDGLGERFAAQRIIFKLHSCCGSTHAAIDSLTDLMRQDRRISAGSIHEIEVRLGRASFNHVGASYHPTDVTTAQFSVAYALAVLLLEGAVFVDQFREGLLADPRVLEITSRVRCVWDPAIDARGIDARNAARIEVRLRDGTQVSAESDAGRGTWSRPATETELVAKYRDLARRALPEGRVEQLASTISDIERSSDSAVLARLAARVSGDPE